MLGTGLILLLAVGILALILISSKNDLWDQGAADRFSEDGDFAQNTILFSTRQGVTDKEIGQLRKEITSAYEQISVIASFEDGTMGTRNLVDCYSATGTITLSTEDRKERVFDVMGVGGDFFRFHPVRLASGAYFDESALMKDYILLDEEAAWYLFGSSDVEGMRVRIGNDNLFVAGVYKREQDEIDNLAQGNEDPKIFMTYDRFKELNPNSAFITTYELLSPNPIPHAAYKVLTGIKLFQEQNVKYVENSNRFSYVHYYELLKGRKSREMRTDDIAYPYWENVARYKEGKLMYVALWQWILAAILLILVSVNVIWFLVEHKPDKDTFVKILDAFREKGRKKRYEEKMRQEEEARAKLEDEPIAEVPPIRESATVVFPDSNVKEVVEASHAGENEDGIQVFRSPSNGNEEEDEEDAEFFEEEDSAQDTADETSDSAEGSSEAAEGDAEDAAESATEDASGSDSADGESGSPQDDSESGDSVDLRLK